MEKKFIPRGRDSTLWKNGAFLFHTVEKRGREESPNRKKNKTDRTDGTNFVAASDF